MLYFLHKKILVFVFIKKKCVDYSQTINRYTELDTYPLPKIDKMINDLAKYNIFSSFINLKSACHQVPLKVSDRKYTAFEVNDRLFQFCRILFGIKNGATAFRRTIDRIIEKNIYVVLFPIEMTLLLRDVHSSKCKKNVRGYRKSRNRSP